MYLFLEIVYSKSLLYNQYEFYSNCERLDVLVLKEPPARRHNSKIKVDQLKYDVKHLQSSFQSHQVSKGLNFLFFFTFMN